MLKNSKLQMLLGGIVLGGLLAFGIFLFASPTQRAYANGDNGRYQLVYIERWFSNRRDPRIIRMDTATGSMEVFTWLANVRKFKYEGVGP